jgi:hypothetical protein
MAPFGHAGAHAGVSGLNEKIGAAHANGCQWRVQAEARLVGAQWRGPDMDRLMPLADV